MNKSNALPILGLYTQQPPQLQERIDDSWKVHLYSDTIYCFRSIIYSLKHTTINRSNDAQNKPKWTGGGDRLNRLGTHIFLTKLVVPSMLKAELLTGTL